MATNFQWQQIAQNVILAVWLHMKYGLVLYYFCAPEVELRVIFLVKSLDAGLD